MINSRAGLTKLLTQLLWPHDIHSNPKQDNTGDSNLFATEQQIIQYGSKAFLFIPQQAITMQPY